VELAPARVMARLDSLRATLRRHRRCRKVVPYASKCNDRTTPDNGRAARRPAQGKAVGLRYSEACSCSKRAGKSRWI